MIIGHSCEVRIFRITRVTIRVECTSLTHQCLPRLDRDRFISIITLVNKSGIISEFPEHRSSLKISIETELELIEGCFRM